MDSGGLGSFYFLSKGSIPKVSQIETTYPCTMLKVNFVFLVFQDCPTEVGYNQGWITFSILLPPLLQVPNTAQSGIVTLSLFISKATLNVYFKLYPSITGTLVSQMHSFKPNFGCLWSYIPPILSPSHQLNSLKQFSWQNYYLTCAFFFLSHIQYHTSNRNINLHRRLFHS